MENFLKTIFMSPLLVCPQFTAQLSALPALGIQTQSFSVLHCWQTPHIYDGLISPFSGLGVACWPLVPKFAGSNPAEAVRFLRAKKKILSTPSFGGEVKPSVPCRRFAACKRSQYCVEIVISAKLPDISRPQFHLSLLGSLASL